MIAPIAARAASARPWWARPAWVLGALALWLLATLAVRPLLLPDEGRYAEVAREMLAGDGWVPLLNGLPFFHKPPLTYWVDMAGMSLFGVHAWSARLGPALGAWLMGASLWLWLRRRRGPQAAGLALVILATCPGFFFGGQYVNHDMLVAGTLTLAILCLARALEDGAPQLGWLCAGWAACGLAVLSKGLIGIVLPALVIGPWLLAQGRWRHVLALLHPLGMLAFVVVAGPWLGVMQQRYADFFDYFIVEQHFRRYATTGFNNQHGFWFYWLVLPFLTLPWCLLAWRWWPLARAAIALPPATWLGRLFEGERRWTTLMAWWVLAIVLFFSMPASKLVGYILPTLAPWAALLAITASTLAWRRWAALGAALCMVAVFGVAMKAPNSHRDVGLALRERVAANDLVVMVDNGFNDAAFEARLKHPPLVASRWDDPSIPHRDNWRKELADTARFAPDLAARLLYPLQDLPQLVCRGQTVWLVVGHDDAALVAEVPGASLQLKGRHAQLWRAPARPCTAAG